MGKPKKWKRGRPKDRRAGCKMCKPWKSNGIKGGRSAMDAQQRRAALDNEEQVKEEA